MKKLAIISFLMGFQAIVGQDLEAFKNSFDAVSHISSPAHVGQQIGVTDVDVVYYRPNTKNREIWGKVVPYGTVWRAGANIATTIEFSDDVLIHGKELEKGKYALFVLPEENEWTFIFDKKSFQFGAFFYQGDSDALRVTVPSSGTNAKVESLIYFFDNVVYNKGELTLAWGDKQASIQITTSEEAILESVHTKVSEAKSNDNHQGYIDAAAWAIDHQKMTENVKEWLAASRKLKDTFGNNFLEARYEASKGNYQKAVEIAKKTGEKFPPFQSVLESFIEKWEKQKV